MKISENKKNLLKSALKAEHKRMYFRFLEEIDKLPEKKPVSITLGYEFTRHIEK